MSFSNEPTSQLKRRRGIYYNGPEWGERKWLVSQRANGICERCKKRPIQHTHHLLYDNEFNEPLTDLLGLCAPCHTFWHRFSKKVNQPFLKDPCTYRDALCISVTPSPRQLWAMVLKPVCRRDRASDYLCGPSLESVISYSPEDLDARIHVLRSVAQTYTNPEADAWYATYVRTDVGAAWKRACDGITRELEDLEREDMRTRWIEEDRPAMAAELETYYSTIYVMA